MSRYDAEHWNERYRAGSGPLGAQSIRRMEHYADHIDTLREQIVGAGQQPRALDIACGAGGTLSWLAQRGWHVFGVDVSEEALSLANNRIRDAGLEAFCTLIHADLDDWRPESRSMHLITQFYFLDRTLLPVIGEATLPGGLLILETMNQHRLSTRPQTNPAHLLNDGELLAMAESWGWQVIEYTTSGPGQRYPTDTIILRRPSSSEKLSPKSGRAISVWNRMQNADRPGDLP